MTARKSASSASPQKQAGSKPRGKGRPFVKGDPRAGRPKGALNRTTRICQELLDGDGEKITRRCINAALRGSPVALKLCIERLIPQRRDAPVEFDLPPITGVADLPNATNAILRALATGELSPSEAAIVNSSIAAHQKSLEMAELSVRLAAVEAKLNG